MSEKIIYLMMVVVLAFIVAACSLALTQVAKADKAYCMQQDRYSYNDCITMLQE